MLPNHPLNADTRHKTGVRGLPARYVPFADGARLWQD